ncbi:hypothetical protein TrCOL_g8041 [Triparma columacea]|uniref:Fe2OG dioxygenase domain-containing protein n=1 Tax=Triparma columacea TaxID=722753 RepID=A0A9W7FZK9_9STRA|nr:hypothetical protein TrCOL_g8041 [Triparma columacea]
MSKPIEVIDLCDSSDDEKVLGGRHPLSSSKGVRSKLAALLQTRTAVGSFSTAGEVSKALLPSIVLNSSPPPSYTDSEAPAETASHPSKRSKKGGSDPLSFPLKTADKKVLRAVCREAGVGGEGAPPGGSVINEDARVTWQVVPNQMTIENAEEYEAQTLSPIVKQCSEGLGISTDWELVPHLYKLLHYEPGCFFRLHRDTERLEGMIGTLVIQLPSKYKGATLSVRSPLSPSAAHAAVYNLSKTSSNIQYVAFYNDCLHEVSELTSGDRVCLIYSLVAKKKSSRSIVAAPAIMKEHPSALPPQPADSAIAIAISKAIKEWDGKGKDPAPAKLAIVLSHRYSPNGLKDMTNLKGTDRGLAELILAARHRIPKTHAEVPSLQKLAAAVLVNEETEGDPAVNTVISDALVEGEDITSEPQFDAYLALAIIWDSGEASPGLHGGVSYHTTGPLVPLLLSDPPLALDLKAPLPMDKKALEPAYEGYGDDRLTRIRSLSGNHSLKILPEEFLIDDLLTRHPYGLYDCGERPQNVEFLGNGMPYRKD